MGMSNADASEAARLAARARWGSRVPDHAAEIVIERYGELADATRARLAELVAGNGAAEDGDGQ